MTSLAGKVAFVAGASRGIGAAAAAALAEAGAAVAVAATVAEFGVIDTLVANAGVLWQGPIEATPLTRWQLRLDVNLTGVFL